MTLHAATVLAIAIVAALAPAQDPQRDPTELLIARLTDTDETRAEAAARDLIRGGAAVAAPLRAALEKSTDQSFLARAERVLAMCLVEGPEVNGLRVGVTIDAAVLEPGKARTLTTTLCNMSDRQVVLWTGMSHAGNVFETGAAMRRLVPSELDGERDGELDEQAPSFGTGFCGTGTYPLTVTIPPWGYVRFEARAIYYRGEPGEEQKPFPLGGVGAHLRLGDFMYLPVEEEGTLRLRVGHEAKLLEKGGTWWQMPEVGPNWAGALRSNELEIELRQG